MVDKLILRSPMADIENRLGIRPLEELLHERQEAIDALAHLRARHGPFGTGDHERKSLLATLAMKARALATRDNIKVTEAALGDMAHASPEYIEWVTQATLDRSQLTLLEARVEAIDAEINRGNVVARYVAAEARL